MVGRVAGCLVDVVEAQLGWHPPAAGLAGGEDLREGASYRVTGGGGLLRVRIARVCRRGPA